MNRKTINRIANFELTSLKGFRKFIKWLVKNNINFHPDDDFNTYTWENGKICFSLNVGNKINRNFEILKSIYTDKYFYKIIFHEIKIEEVAKKYPISESVQYEQ
jgi:hypothetical protein